MTRILFVLCAVCFVMFGGGSVHAENGFRKAAFIRPNVSDRFWDVTEDAMRAACRDLGVELDVHRIDQDAFRIVQKAQQLADAPDKPDVVFFEAWSVSTLQTIRILDEAGIDSFTFNTVFDDKTMARVGGPREKYKHWIGSIHPDDYEAGKIIAERLYQEAQARGLLSRNKVQFLAIEGEKRVSPSGIRLAGLRGVIEAHKDARLLDTKEGYWGKDEAQKAALSLLREHAGVNVIWAVNDSTAMGAVEALEEAGFMPGKDVLVAGIDWVPEVFDYIRGGRIQFSLGGHFMEGAWAVVLAYDYKNGHDFAPEEGVDITSPWYVIDQGNAGLYADKLEHMDFDHIDFKALSKVHNPALQAYDFNVLALIQEP